MQLKDLYTDGHGKIFVITGLEIRENDPWVHYQNQETNQEYSCRQEAFLVRFSLLPQSR